MLIQNTNYFTDKKIRVSFILALLVFFIHFCAFSTFKVFVPTTTVGRLFVDINNLILAASKMAVPLFFILSGALFYKNYTFKSTLSKWKARFFSLVVPYLIWNTMWLCLALLSYYTPLSALLGGVKAQLTIENVLAGIFLHEYFLPFWFIKILIVFVVFCPAIFILVKNKWFGVVSIFVAAIMCVLDLPYITAVESTSFLYYLIGAWIGVHGFSQFSSSGPKVKVYFAIVCFAVCFMLIVLSDNLAEVAHFYFKFEPIIISAYALSFWRAFDVFRFKNCHSYQKETFLIYALHSLVGATFSKVLYIVLPKGDIFIVLNGIITLILTIACICFLGFFLGKYFPKLKKALTGR